MRNSRRPIVIVSRGSHLARRQAHIIGDALGRRAPHVDVEYRWVETEGDRAIDVPLSSVSGKGLFVRKIERVLLTGQADIAVHSLKDLPARETTQGLTIAAIGVRANARDCLIGRNGEKSVEELPPGATVGTSSPRRAAQLLRWRSDLNIQFMRGNVETRLRKVREEAECDATILALAGLHRSGLHDHGAVALDPDVMLPAAGQGALAVQCRADDHVTIRRCLPINEPITAAATHAERSVVAGLEADCHSAIGALAEPIGDRGVEGFRLRVRVLTPDGSQCIDTDDRLIPKTLHKMLKQIVIDLVKRGAPSLLETVPADLKKSTQAI